MEEWPFSGGGGVTEEHAFKSVWGSDCTQARQLDRLALQLLLNGMEEFLMETDLCEPEGLGCDVAASRL